MQTAVFLGGSIGPFIGGTMADHYGYRIPFGVTGGLLFLGGALVLFGARERFTPPDPNDRASVPPLRVLLRNPTVLGLLGVFFVLNISLSFVGPIFPLFVEQVSGSAQRAATDTGFLLAIAGVASAISAGVIGKLGDRLGHKSVIVTCTVLTGLLSFPHYFAQSLPQLAVLRILLGLATGGMMPAMNALVAHVVPRSTIGQAYGFATTASSLGWAAGPALGGFAAAAFGYRWPFVMMGALLLLVAVSQQRWITAGTGDQVDRP
jgi:DHA1 family multidrug resistance protein-like MFS transporter